MRVAPVGFVTGIDPFTVAAEAASITHGHPSGYLSAGAFAVMVAEAAAGRSLTEAAERALTRLGRFRGHDETRAAVIAAIDLAEREPIAGPEVVERLGGGWVGEEALAIALYAALTADSFEAGVAAAVNHSGDSDSTGSIAGNLLGARYGVASIPGHLLDGLVERDLVRSVAADFADLA
jgi:ADP-ribosylglycohydrolase